MQPCPLMAAGDLAADEREFTPLKANTTISGEKDIIGYGWTTLSTHHGFLQS